MHFQILSESFILLNIPIFLMREDMTITIHPYWRDIYVRSFHRWHLANYCLMHAIIFHFVKSVKRNGKTKCILLPRIKNSSYLMLRTQIWPRWSHRFSPLDKHMMQFQLPFNFHVQTPTLFTCRRCAHGPLQMNNIGQDRSPTLKRERCKVNHVSKDNPLRNICVFRGSESLGTQTKRDLDLRGCWSCTRLTASYFCKTSCWMKFIVLLF